MRCPSCSYAESKVVDSRPSDDNSSIRRRRECLQCGHRFTTYERLESTPIVIVKADGSSEAYDPDKLFRGILIACAKRPISSNQIDSIIEDIEAEVRNNMKGSIRSKDLGDKVLDRLRILDDVAYIRFASVYKDFQDIEEFANALES